MKYKLFNSWCERPLTSSATGLEYLSLFVVIIGMLSGCSTRIETENGQATSPQVVPTTQTLPYTVPPSTNVGTYSPPIDNSTPYYPPTTAPVEAALTCYLARSGGYYYVGYPVRWDFYADSGQPLEVVRLDSGEYWSTPPQYPLPASFGITFYTVGQRQLAFTVRSKTNPSQYCNNGQPIYDTVHINRILY